MDLHKYTCEACGDDFETTEILTDDDDIVCGGCEDDFAEEGEDEIDTEFDDEDSDEDSEDEEDELEDDEELDEDEEN